MTKLQTLTLERINLSSRQRQMIRGVHPDFLICSKALCCVFSSIEKKKSWDLMLYLIPELATLFAHAPEVIESTLYRGGI